MADIDFKVIEDSEKRLASAAGYLHIESKIASLEKLEDKSSAENFWDNATLASETLREASELRRVISEYTDAKGALEDLRVAAELASDDESFADEFHKASNVLEAMLDKLEVNSWFSGEFDSSSCILSVNPGSGGLEAQDWTEMLFKMYSRYCESKDWKIKILDIAKGTVIGIDKVVVQIDGTNAYGMLKSETGVHRLVRVSPTDIKGRRHTTFAGVEVLPLLPETAQVDLDMCDVKVDVYRSSGPGGQSVNTTDSAVRLTHIPTGIVVTCQNEKSQLMNKASAMSVLRSKLYEIKRQEREEEIDKLRGERRENSFGSQIRNYVMYPYRLVKDLRSGVETGNVDAVLNGEIEEFVIAYHKWNSTNQA